EEDESAGCGGSAGCERRLCDVPAVVRRGECKPDAGAAGQAVPRIHAVASCTAGGAAAAATTAALGRGERGAGALRRRDRSRELTSVCGNGERPQVGSPVGVSVHEYSSETVWGQPRGWRSFAVCSQEKPIYRFRLPARPR